MSHRTETEIGVAAGFRGHAVPFIPTKETNVTYYRFECPRGHRFNNVVNGAEKVPPICPSCGWDVRDDGGVIVDHGPMTHPPTEETNVTYDYDSPTDH